MKFKAIKGHQGIGTEVKDTTYVEAARWGKYRGWRYVLGLMIIFFAWMVAANSVVSLVNKVSLLPKAAQRLGRIIHLSTMKITT